MDYETGKKFEEIDIKLEYLFKTLDKNKLIPEEDKKESKESKKS